MDWKIRSGAVRSYIPVELPAILGRDLCGEVAAAGRNVTGFPKGMRVMALANGKFISAGEHLQRAGVYYHFGKFLFVHDVPQMKTAHGKAVECRTLALPHLNPPGERVTILYQGKALYGILRKPRGIEKPPVLIMCVGLDSAKEETEAYERPYLDRGIATLVFDGPGQGEGEYDFAIRGDYEVAVKAAPQSPNTWGMLAGFQMRRLNFEQAASTASEGRKHTDSAALE